MYTLNSFLTKSLSRSIHISYLKDILNLYLEETTHDIELTTESNVVLDECLLNNFI